MKAIKNCIFAIRTVFHYAPLNAVLYTAGFFVPAFFTGAQMLLIQHIVDSGAALVQGRGELRPVVCWSGLLVIMLTLWVSLQKLGSYEMTVIRTRLTRRMAPDIADRLTDLEYAGFEEKGVQEVFQKMSNEPQEMVAQCFDKTMNNIQGTMSLIFSMAVFFSISVWVGVGVLLIGIPTSILGYLSAGKRRLITKESADAKRRMADLKGLLSNKHAMYEMKLFSSEELFARKWDQSSGELADITLREGRKALIIEIASNLLQMLYVVFIIFTVTYSFFQGSITLGQFTAAFSGASTIGNKLYSAAWQMSLMLKHAMEMDFYMEFLSLEPRKDKGEVEFLDHYHIAFENVSFRYPGTEQEILRNVTFYVKDGERIAFVGENGAGKSTIIKLLCGLYEPTTGRVTVGGVPVRSLSETFRQKLLSVVFQDFQGYQMTLRENIAFGNIDRMEQDGELIHALRLAGGEELLADKQGLGRNLGKLEEDGQDLSRGQWQRVAMARAFVSDARYVILDEPTAALDPIAESRMYENFAKIFHERGTIMISHRLASARMANRILVLDGGRIVQTGNHEELMKKGGLYREMYLAQSSWYSVKEVTEGAVSPVV
ncbi:MAG: ABC transporter ATP-binding protein/permease [Lachnospiraceae bacterium]|nr:ABC transporter ATP-binding protein/permease [Lachnospiraceae bacterium]MCM1239297.1 ABC transporter ATP-binding protein/permease [Lachnospiraceae bacterium]